MLDPGIGFGKTRRAQPRAARSAWTSSLALGRPLVVGTSRKSFLGAPRRRRRGAAEPRRAPTRGCPGRSPPACSRSSAARSVFRVHDVAPVSRRAGGGGCYVGRAMDGEEHGDDADELDDEEPTRLDEDARGDGRVGHDRDHRPVAVHPPRRQRGRARGRPAAGARPAPGRRRNRRHRDRLDRGHGRLRRGLPAGRAARPAALAPARSSGCAARSPTGCSPTTSSRACG